MKESLFSESAFFHYMSVFPVKRMKQILANFFFLQPKNVNYSKKESLLYLVVCATLGPEALPWDDAERRQEGQGGHRPQAGHQPAGGGVGEVLKKQERGLVQNAGEKCSVRE